LAATCAYGTIKQYLTGVRILHLEAGYANPLPAFFNLQRTLHGIKRVKEDTNSNRKLTVTPDILAWIIRRLTFFPLLMAFTAAMLVAFFGFFREANICPAKISRTPAEDTSPVRRCDFEFAPGLALVWVNLRRTKPFSTVSALSRSRYQPYLARFYARLWPFSAYFPPSRPPPEAFAFLREERPGSALTTLTHLRTFVQTFKTNLPSVGLDPAHYAGHLFSRGGATFAFQCGALAAQGD
jgi:hypothetical protein